MANHAKVFFWDVTNEPFDEFFNRNSFRFVTVNDFVFIRKRNELLFIRVVHDISFRQTRPFSIPSDIASGIVSIRKFFTNEHIPDDFVKQLSNREEISNAVFFPPERLNRYWNRENFFFKFLTHPLTKFLHQYITEPSLKNLFRKEGTGFPRERAIKRRESAIRDKNVDMGMKVQSTPKGVHNSGNARHKPLFTTPR